MTDTALRIAYYLDNPNEPVDPAWLDQMQRLHPGVTVPATLLLSREHPGVGDDMARALTERLAILSPSRETLASILLPEAAGWLNFYPPQQGPEPLTTDQVIDRFIDNYGGRDPKEDALLERLIFHPTADYAQVLAEEEESSLPSPNEAPEGSQDALINSFILEHHNAGSTDVRAAMEGTTLDDHNQETTGNKQGAVAPSPAPDKPSDPATTRPTPALSESLAKIYTKQGRYEQAFEIISQLSLNNPEKSIYFADQLRFLRKLIKIQHLSNQSTEKSQKV
ncbi:MAG: hypothetical protein LIP02_10695 [Bacteroidales bacterium]|nr:hypothetical protein [Bacteroidales bacterium]